MKMKKIIAVMALLGSFSTAGYAVPIDIMVNNKIIKTDTAPVIEIGTVLAPIRAVANALGCDDVSWDGKTQTAAFVNKNDEINITIGKKTALVNGEEKKLQTPAKIVNDRTLVPIRFIAETFNAKVDWDDKTYTVLIDKDGHQVDTSVIDTSYTHEELSWLAKIVHAEARGENMDGKIGVANVVLNRVESNDFPDNVYDVIFDRKYGVQFTPVANGTIHNNAGKDSYKAAKKAIKGENTVGDSLYFCNPVISTNFWIMNNRQFFKSIGGHDFYL